MGSQVIVSIKITLLIWRKVNRPVRVYRIFSALALADYQKISIGQLPKLLVREGNTKRLQPNPNLEGRENRGKT